MNDSRGERKTDFVFLNGHLMSVRTFSLGRHVAFNENDKVANEETKQKPRKNKWNTKHDHLSSIRLIFIASHGSTSTRYAISSFFTFRFPVFFLFSCSFRFQFLLGFPWHARIVQRERPIHLSDYDKRKTIASKRMKIVFLRWLTLDMLAVSPNLRLLSS